MTIQQLNKIYNKYHTKFIFNYNENILYLFENNKILMQTNSINSKNLVDHFFELFNFYKNLKQNIYYSINLYTKNNEKTKYSLIIDDQIIINVKNAGLFIFNEKFINI